MSLFQTQVLGAHDKSLQPTAEAPLHYNHICLEKLGASSFLPAQTKVKQPACNLLPGGRDCSVPMVPAWTSGTLAKWQPGGCWSGAGPCHPDPQGRPKARAFLEAHRSQFCLPAQLKSCVSNVLYDLALDSVQKKEQKASCVHPNVLQSPFCTNF